MSQTIRILIAEDNAADAELILRELRRSGYDPIWERVDTEAAFLERLHSGLDVILSDYEMRGFRGPRALELLQERKLDVPFIMISGTIGEDIAVSVMMQGAADYLLKDRLTRLGQAVSRAIHENRLRRERQQAMDALWLFRSLMDQSSDTFEIIDPATSRFLDVNERGCAAEGYTREEFLALRVIDIDPTLTMETWQILAEKIRLAGPVSGEGVHRRKDGTTFPIEFSAKWVHLDRDYIVTVVRDISARKNMEQQFLRAQRMESIGTLAGGIAHDLNNALGPIMMSLDLLKLRFTDPNSVSLIDLISSSAHRGAEMVRQVLSLARGLEGQRIAVNLGPLICEIEHIANDTFLKHIRIRTRTAADLWTVPGDPTQIHQVLLNLCVNARDAMPEGGTILISAENLMVDEQYAGLELEARSGPYVLVQVQDEGTGMPPDVIRKIFDPFFTTKEVGKGTGLGLSTTLGIVKSHGGFIRVQSEPGCGATFQVYLPAQSGPTATPEAARPAELPHGRGELILVVDDEPNVRAITQHTLETFGYQVLVAVDGAEAVVSYASHRADIALVITDMMMPVMDGPATIRVLRKLNPALPIIAASGLAHAGQFKEAAKLGVKHFLDKPYTAETLLTVLRKALDPT